MIVCAQSHTQGVGLQGTSGHGDEATDAVVPNALVAIVAPQLEVPPSSSLNPNPPPAAPLDNAGH